ncbi:MAG TPA: ABC transporter permease subunit [Ruminiclostridium sp.]
MNATWNIARKEITDALRNKLFLTILGMLLTLTVVSVVLGAYQVRMTVDNYNNSINFLKSLGKADLPPMPNLNPISASKGFVNYIGMLGALLAMILGNSAIVKERRSGTLKLILSRRVFRDTLLNGKLLGNLTLLAGITLLSGVITFISVFAIGKVVLSGGDVVRMGLFFLMSFLYMTFFLVLGITLAVMVGNGNKALLLTVIIWLVLAFVFPQIGETMDMDNQLPGGFFAQMGMTRDQEHKLLEKFKFYETLRDGIEEMSPTKHYERISFALLNVKPGFEKNTPTEVLGLKWINLLGLTAPSIILWLIAYMAFLRREDIYQN